MTIDKHITKTFIFQKDQSDCGVACLSSIINYYGGLANQEKIRIVSGTNKQGTTLLGLYQAANGLGFEAEGMQGDPTFLKSLSNPAILHVVTNERMLHYVVFYGSVNNQFLVGDPALGVRWISEDALNDMWKSGKMLTLSLDENRFTRVAKETRSKWQWLYRLVKDDFKLLTTILIIGVAIAVLGLATAVFAQVFIDNLIPSGNPQRIFVSIFLIGCLLLARSIISYFRQQLTLKQGVDINIRITGNFLTNLFLLPLPFFATRKIGDMVARLNDIGRIQQAISYLFGELLISVLVVLASLTALFIYSFWIGIMLLVSIPLFGWVAYKYQQPVIMGQRELMASYALNESNYINTINNIQPLKSYKREKLFTSIALSIFSIFQGKAFGIGKLGATIQLLTGLVGLAVTIGIVALSAFQMLAGEMSAGVFMAVFSLSTSILPALANIAFTNVQIQGARVAFERMYEFSSMDKEFEENEENRKSKVEHFAELDFKGVSFRYPGRALIIDNLTFSVKKGELVTIFGDNGTGKSTIPSLVQRFYLPESGDILVNNIPVEEVSIPSYRNNLGVVPQDITLINATLMANITLSDSENDNERALDILGQYGLHSYFELFPQGYLTMLGDGGVQISGGQKQLVG
ncbi:MAG: cysteine peptidase family C39 domain-containing protein, partial [Bacteroidales bacterium]|nr:cysteine peptidase family C39 domain-containing protein [Bacteroidales bacterium]